MQTPVSTPLACTNTETLCELRKVLQAKGRSVFPGLVSPEPCRDPPRLFWQGSTLSTLLCSLFLGALEAQHLRPLIPSRAQPGLACSAPGPSSSAPCSSSGPRLTGLAHAACALLSHSLWTSCMLPNVQARDPLQAAAPLSAAGAGQGSTPVPDQAPGCMRARRHAVHAADGVRQPAAAAGGAGRLAAARAQGGPALGAHPAGGRLPLHQPLARSCRGRRLPPAAGCAGLRSSLFDIHASASPMH